MYIDYITYADVNRLRTHLLAEGMVGPDGKPLLAITKVPKVDIFKHGISHTFSIVRVLCKEEDALIHKLAEDNVLTLMGEVEKDTYVFYTKELRLTYEEIMGVGEFEKLLPALDEDGNYILDEDFKVVMAEPRPYMFGLFA